MRSLIQTYLPNAPKMGLHVDPNIPESKLRNARKDYAGNASESDILALFDGTLMGSGKDGIVFLPDRLIYQNTDLDPAQEIRYDDIVRVNKKRRLLGGKQILLDVNSGSATVVHTLDCSGRPDAAEYISRFLHEAMLHMTLENEKQEQQQPVAHKTGTGTDVDAVYGALEALQKSGKLSPEDFRLLVDTLMNA